MIFFIFSFLLLVRCFSCALPIYLGCAFTLFNEFQLLIKIGLGTLSIHKSECREVAVVPLIFDPLNYDQIACQAELELGSDLF